MLDPQSKTEIEAIKSSIRDLNTRLSAITGTPSTSSGSLASDQGARLAVYGLRAENVILDDLNVTSGESIQLTSIGTDKYNRYLRIIKPQSLEQLKQWVGVDDVIVRKMAQVGGSTLTMEPSLTTIPIVSPESAEEAATVTRLPDQRANLQLACKTYLRGDSAKYSAWSSQMSKVLPLVGIRLIAYRDITIGTNATLNVGADIDVLHCRHLIINRGGTLVSKGRNLKIDCMSAQGNV